MHQVGASLTDWGVSAACLVSLLVLQQHSAAKRRIPRWYWMFMLVYLAEGIACFAGGFMWSSGTNKTCRLMAELPPLVHMWCFIMIQGMAAEGLGLIMASRELGASSEGSRSFVSQALPETLALGVCCVFYGVALVAGASISIIYQFLLPLAAGLGAISTALTRRIRSCENSKERGLWTQLLVGHSLNLVGAAALGLLDNDCTGLGCITEFVPWESNPCRFGTANPVGSSCALPEWFNHAAVMHTTAILSCAVTVPALCGLLDCEDQKAPQDAGPQAEDGPSRQRPGHSPKPRRRGAGGAVGERALGA